MNNTGLIGQHNPIVPKKSQSNYSSKLISDEENEVLFKTLGPRCQVSFYV